MKFYFVSILSAVSFSLLAQQAHAGPFSSIQREFAKSVRRVHHKFESFSHQATRATFKTVLRPVRGQLEQPIQQAISITASADPVRIVSTNISQGYSPFRNFLTSARLHTLAQAQRVVEVERTATPQLPAGPRLDLLEEKQQEDPRLIRVKEQFSEGQIQSASLAIVRLFNRQDNPSDRTISRTLCLTAGLSQKAAFNLVDAIRSGICNEVGEDTLRAHQFLLHSKFPIENMVTAANVILTGCEEKQPFETMVSNLCEVLDIEPELAQEVFDYFKRGVFNDYGNDALQAHNILVDEEERLLHEAFTNQFTNEHVRVAGQAMIEGHRNNITQDQIISDIASRLKFNEDQARTLFQGIIDGDLV